MSELSEELSKDPAVLCSTGKKGKRRSLTRKKNASDWEFKHSDNYLKEMTRNAMKLTLIDEFKFPIPPSTKWRMRLWKVSLHF